MHTINRLFYLVDVELPFRVEEELIARNDFLRMLSNTGPLCLNHYIHAMDPAISMPNMRSKLYVAPMIDLSAVGEDITEAAFMLTPPHRDGHGTQSSVHTQLFGSGRNLVRIWPLSHPSQDVYFQRIVGLPPLDQEQHLPHHASFRFDTSANEWDCKRENQLRRHGIHALTTVLQSETTVLLLSGWPHTFKKVCCAQRSHNPPTPLVGFAGDISYIGATPEVVIRRAVQD